MTQITFIAIQGTAFPVFHCVKRNSDITPQTVDKSISIYRLGKSKYMDSKSRRRRMRALLKRHDGKCVYCSTEVLTHVHHKHPQRATMDHVIPRVLGGAHNLLNLVLSCRACNQKKANSLAIPVRNNPKEHLMKNYQITYTITQNVDASTKEDAATLGQNFIDSLGLAPEEGVVSYAVSENQTALAA